MCEGSGAYQKRITTSKTWSSLTAVPVAGLGVSISSE